jgi:hypothetical protein
LLCQHVLMERLAWSSGTVLPLGVAMGVAIMTKLGIAHPPAAAAMVAMLDHYRPGETTFGSSVMAAAVLLLANVVAISLRLLSITCRNSGNIQCTGPWTRDGRQVWLGGPCLEVGYDYPCFVRKDTPAAATSLQKCFH